jgi:hypothetical protein
MVYKGNILISGLFPEAWSIAVMVPVFKRGDPSDPNNFRGISLGNDHLT